MKKYTLIIIIIFILILSPIFLWYLNKSFIPEKVRSSIIEGLEKNTEFTAQIKDVKFSLKGFELYDVKIFEKKDPEKFILKTDKAWFRPLFFPGLNKIYIIIPTLYLQSPDIRINRDIDGAWNFKKFTIKTKASPSTKKGGLFFSVLKVSLKDGDFAFSDKFQDKNITQNISNINGTLGLSLPNSVKFALRARFNESNVSLKGKITDLVKKPVANLKITISKFDLKDIVNLDEIGIEDGLATIKATASLGADGTSSIKAATDIVSFKFRRQNLRLSGDFKIDTQINGNLRSLDLADYKGKINFDNAKLLASDLFPPIYGAKGEVLFNNKEITIKKFNGIIADSPVSISGSLDYTSQVPDMDVSISTTDPMNLTKLLEHAPQQIKEKLKQVAIDGIADLNINILSKKDKSPGLLYKGYLRIADASLGSSFLKEKIKNIECSVLFEKDRITWDKLSFNYANYTYRSSGITTELEAPLINGVLESEDFKAKGMIKIQENAMDIKNLNISYRNNALGITGKLKNFNQPIVAIDGNVTLDLADAELVLTKYKEKIEKLKPKGKISGSFRLNGPLNDPVRWNFQAKAKSDEIILDKFNLGNTYFETVLKDDFLYIPIFTMKPYGGIIDITSKLNLSTQEKPYLVNIEAKDVDLKKMITGAGLLKDKPKKIEGLLSSKIILNGFLGNKDSLRGNGWIQVSDGYLGKFPIVYDMLDAIIGIPPEYITLTAAFGNFNIQDKRIFTNDFKLLSEKAALVWEGSLGFDKTLDFTVTGRFAEDISTKTTSLGKIASTILHQAGQYIVEVRLTGTIDNPKYDIIPFPVQKIFEEKVMDKLKDAFGDMFE